MPRTLLKNPSLSLLAGALVIGTLILDIGVAEIHWLMPASVQPSDQNFVKNPKDNGSVLIRLAEVMGKPCSLVFIGASNIEYWATSGREVWDRNYAPYDALNFGVAGDRTEDLLWRLKHTDLSSLHPKAVVVFVGLNNSTDTPRDLAAGVISVAKHAFKLFPGAKVLIVSETPNVRNVGTAEIANTDLRAFADNRNFFYIDLYARMTREGDKWKGLGPDGVHLSAEGYELWVEAMRPVLDPLLAGQPRVGEKSSP